MNREIEKYIQKRYNRWSEYARFQASLAGIPEEGLDVLNEVLLNLLKKDPKKLMKLHEKQKGKYRELDFFVLRMIALNCKSKTSPYQFKYHHQGLLIDKNSSGSLLQDDTGGDSDFFDDETVSSQGSAVVEGEESDHLDSEEAICQRMDVIRSILEGLQIPEMEKKIYSFRNIQGEPFTQWPGTEALTFLYQVNNKVRKMIQIELDKRILTDALRRALESLPRKNDKALARLIYIHGFQPDELREAGFPVKYLFTLYRRMRSELKVLSINYLKL